VAAVVGVPGLRVGPSLLSPWVPLRRRDRCWWRPGLLGGTGWAPCREGVAGGWAREWPRVSGTGRGGTPVMKLAVVAAVWVGAASFDYFCAMLIAGAPGGTRALE